MAGQNLVAFFPALARAGDGFVTGTGCLPEHVGEDRPPTRTGSRARR